MRKLFLLIICFIPAALMAKEPVVLGLEEAYQLAIRNYPLTKQKDLIARTSGLNMKSLSSGFWPQVTLSGQATYQSAVTEVPIKIPQFQFESLSKDQYRAVLDINQSVFDGGNVKSQKSVLEQQRLVDEQKIDVEYQKLKERINDIWFSVLFIDEQLKLVGLSQKDIEAVIKKVQAQVDQGTSYRSSLASLQAEKLRNDQRSTDLSYSRKALIDVLSVFIGQELPRDAELKYPAEQTADTSSIKRPEIELLKRQVKLNDEMRKTLDVRKTPRVSLFAQGGYGKPGFNMLVNEFDFFYIGGVRLAWNLNGFYNFGRDRQVNDYNRQSLGLQEEQLMMNIRAELKKSQGDIDKYRDLISSDDQIIVLRKQVKDASAAQLENGVITSSDYIRELNAEEQARQNQVLHRLQLLQAIIDQKTTTGN
ncbi:MAG TPA: TolC family protein [Chitinophagaceae bacterium]|nr:TolC family protein [Chitinophagaceae bacterium]